MYPVMARRTQLVQSAGQLSSMRFSREMDFNIINGV